MPTFDWEFIAERPKEALPSALHRPLLIISGLNIGSKIVVVIVGKVVVVEVEVVYEEGSMTGDKLVVYLLESGILQDQTNYYNNDPTSPYYQLGNPIPDFEQNHGLRNSFTNLTGDEITGTAALETITRTFSLAIPEYYNNENLSIVAMVVNSDNSTRNAQTANVGENKSYE